MRKEYFDAHFHPQGYPLGKRFSNSLGYLLSALVFQGVPLPQREAGARETMRYLGGLAAQGVCPLIFPEGKHSHDESIGRFLPGVAMMAARLKLPVVPVRIRGANRVLHPTWRMARPGFVDVCLGKPVHLEGEDYVSLARTLEQILRGM
jgi:long-chain acyl-CoA synthetase